MTEHRTDQLSDYLDDELTPAERAGIESHLAVCRECSTTLDELRTVVARAGALLPRPPGNDLWPGIEPRLTGARDGQILPFTARPSRRISFTLPQLAAVICAAGTPSSTR